MAQGKLYTFNDTVTVSRTVSGLIHNIDPMDIQMQSYLGTNNQGKFKIQNFPNHKVEWMADTYRVRTSAINNGAGYNDSVTSIVVDDGTKFKPGDVLEIGIEYVWVSAVSTNTLTITRGAGGTTAAAMVDDQVVTYKWSARLEGDDSDDYPYTTPTETYNYSQILHGEIDVTGSERYATTRIGMSDKYKYELMKLIGGAGGGNGRPGRAGDLPLDLENTFFGDQDRIVRTSAIAGMMGGYKYYVTGNTLAAASATLSEDAFLDTVQLAWADGGKPRLIVMNAFNKRLFNTWYKDSITTERSERTGGVVINKVETDFGVLDLMLHRGCPADEVYIIDPDTVGWVTLRPWAVEPLAKTGDSDKDQVIGEFSFVVTTPNSNAIITGTATS